MFPLATKYNRKLCKYQVELLQRFSWAETRQSWMSHTAHRSTLFILASWRHCMVITFYLICFLDIKVRLFLGGGSLSDPQFMWPGTRSRCNQQCKKKKDEPLWSRLYQLLSIVLIFTSARKSRFNCGIRRHFLPARPTRRHSVHSMMLPLG